ncbi:MAG: calcium/sodium antiporter [Muribaculaceae bacterium]|nr:calcium/sodium antiporter [Muribaculaceae bacterium]
MLEIIYLVGGLALILVGANALTDGSSAIARRWGVSELVIGLTIVAFGTSAPELVISVMSAARGATQLAIGNVVGSNIFNILAIIGVVAMVRPIRVAQSTMSNEIPMALLAAVALLIIGNGPMLGSGGVPQINRVDSLLLLLFFAIFMRYTFHQARKQTELESPSEPDNRSRAMSPLKAWAWVIGGLAMLVGGGDLFVDGASALASRLGVSQAIIGLTIVAAGTSLPELATSVVAARKGKSDLAIGNVVGSNIFNIFLVAGLSGTVRPLQFGSIGNIDLLTLTLSSLLFLAMARWGGTRIITRSEGAILVVLYVAYTVYLISTV